MSKVERDKRKRWKCPIPSHKGSNGLSHHACFNKLNGITERIGFYDIECSNLSADFGIILSYCILSEDKKLYKRVLTPAEIKSGVFDKNLLNQFCQDIRNFDRVMGWYSSRFDMPFLRTRCIYHKIDFPMYGEIRHTDLWKFARNNLKLHSNRLGTVAPFFGIKAKEHPLDGEVWLKCLSGNQEALNFVLTHNIEDVHSTRGVYCKIQNYLKLARTSI